MLTREHYQGHLSVQVHTFGGQPFTYLEWLNFHLFGELALLPGRLVVSAGPSFDDWCEYCRGEDAAGRSGREGRDSMNFSVFCLHRMEKFEMEYLLHQRQMPAEEAKEEEEKAPSHRRSPSPSPLEPPTQRVKLEVDGTISVCSSPRLSVCSFPLALPFSVPLPRLSPFEEDLPCRVPSEDSFPLAPLSPIFDDEVRIVNRLPGQAPKHLVFLPPLPRPPLERAANILRFGDEPLYNVVGSPRGSFPAPQGEWGQFLAAERLRKNPF